MKINRKELLGVLQKTKPAIINKGIVQSDSFIFDNDIIYSQNDELTISHPFNSEIKGAVRAQKLYDLLQKIKEDNIRFNQQGNELILKTQKTNAGLKFDTEIQRELLQITKEFYPLPDNFIDGLSFSMFSASNDGTKFPLNCLQIKENNIIACDNFRLTHFKLEKEIKDDFLIPINIANILISYTDKINKYYVFQGNVYFKNDSGVIFSFREVHGEYPDTEQLLNIEGSKITLPNSFIDSILRAEIISNVTDEFMRIIGIEIEDNKILCKSNSEDGWIIETNKIDYNGDKIVFSINSIFLKEILKHTSSFILGDSILFQHKNFKHIIAKIVK